jgi:hypothetical protein
MKKFNKLFSIVIIALLLFNCKKDDDGSGADANQLIGSWRLTSESDSDGFSETFQESCANIWVFTDNTISTSFDDDCDGTPEAGDGAMLSYSLSGNQFIFQVDTDGEELYLESVSNTNLRLRLVDESDPEEVYTIFFDFIKI